MGERDNGGNGGSIYQVYHEVITSDDMPELTTQITGLADNTYDVWVFFWDPDNAEFTIDAGLTSGSLDVYSFDGPGDTTSPVDAGTLTFSNSPAPISLEGNRNMYGVNIGQATVAGGSAIDVFIDNTTGGVPKTALGMTASVTRWSPNLPPPPDSPGPSRSASPSCAAADSQSTGRPPDSTT